MTTKQINETEIYQKISKQNYVSNKSIFENAIDQEWKEWFSLQLWSRSYETKVNVPKYKFKKI